MSVPRARSRRSTSVAAKLTIDGVEYTISPSADVTVQGSYGAFTMLQVGMKAEFWYMANDRRIITVLDQVPDNFQILEH